MSETKNQVAEAPVAETTVETKAVVLNFDNLRKLDHAGIVAACIASKQYENNAAMKVNNVNVRNISEKESALSDITIIVNRPLPAFMPTPTGGRELSVSKNVFVAAFQIASVLKETGETAFANRVNASPASAIAMLEGARVSVLTRHYAAGEVELNPFSSKESDYVFEQDTVRHYLYDISLGETGKAIKQEMIRLLAAQMLA